MVVFVDGTTTPIFAGYPSRSGVNFPPRRQLRRFRPLPYLPQKAILKYGVSAGFRHRAGHLCPPTMSPARTPDKPGARVQPGL
jgi:hypothetical protein